MLSIWLVIIIILLLVFLKVVSKDYMFLKDFPGLRVYPIIGNLFELIGCDQSQVFKLMRRCSAQFGTYRFWALGVGQIHTARAKEAEVLLSSTRHTDKSEMYRFLIDFLGTGLLISNGPKWQKRRKILTPAFHFNILQQFTTIFNEESTKVVELIHGHVEKGKGVLDVSKISCRATLNIICETAMGVKLDSIGNADEYRKNLYKVIEIIIHRVMRPWLYVDQLFRVLGYQRQVDKFVDKIQGFTESIIARRRLMFQGLPGDGEQAEDVTTENM